MKSIYDNGVGITPANIIAVPTSGASISQSGTAIRVSYLASSFAQANFYVNQAFDMDAYDFLFFEVTVPTRSGAASGGWARCGIMNSALTTMERGADVGASPVPGNVTTMKQICGLFLDDVTGMKNPSVYLTGGSGQITTVDIYRIMLGSK